MFEDRKEPVGRKDVLSKIELKKQRCAVISRRKG